MVAKRLSPRPKRELIPVQMSLGQIIHLVIMIGTIAYWGVKFQVAIESAAHDVHQLQQETLDLNKQLSDNTRSIAVIEERLSDVVKRLDSVPSRR